MLGLAMRAKYFGGPLTWWFSPLGPILLLSHCEPYKMEKLPYIAIDFYFIWVLVVNENKMNP